MDEFIEAQDSNSALEKQNRTQEIINSMLEVCWDGLLQESADTGSSDKLCHSAAEIDRRDQALISKAFLLREVYLSLGNQPPEQRTGKLKQYRDACIQILNYAEGDLKYGKPFSFFKIYPPTGLETSHGENLDADLVRFEKGDVKILSDLISNSSRTRIEMRNNSRSKVVRYVLFELQNMIESAGSALFEERSTSWSGSNVLELRMCYSIIEAHLLHIVSTVFPDQEELI